MWTELSTEEGIEKFWQWFAKRSEHIRDLYAEGRLSEIAAEISAQLDGIDNRLAWEIGPATGSALTLVLSAEGDPHLDAVAEALQKSTPPLSGWVFSRYRQTKDISTIESILRSQGYQIDLTQATAHPSVSPDRSRVDVQLVLPSAQALGPEDERNSVAFQILDGVLGEQAVEAFIGEVKLLNRSESKGIPLARFREFVHELFSG